LGGSPLAPCLRFEALTPPIIPSNYRGNDKFHASRYIC
jgi:hypothetical protein